MNITELRQKYPDYNDMSDQEFADAFHDKFYSDIPKTEFYEKLGIGSKEQDTSTVDDLITGVKGTGAFIGDLASGLVKMPVQAAAAAMAKIARPDLSLNETWEQAGKSIEGYTPSFGSQIGPNKVYETAMKPLDLYGRGVDYVAGKAGELTGSPDVEGVVKIAGNFAPIPFAGKAGRLAGKVLEKVDPALRKPVEVTRDPVANLDSIAPLVEEPTSGAKAGELPGVIDHEYLAERRAQDQIRTTLEEQAKKAEAERQGIQMDSEQVARQARDAATREDVAQIQAREVGPKLTKEEILRRTAEEQNAKFLAEQKQVREQDAIARSEVNDEYQHENVIKAEAEKEGILKEAEAAKPEFQNAAYISELHNKIKEQSADIENINRTLDEIQKNYSEKVAPIKGSVGGNPTIRKVPRSQRGGLNIDAIAKVLGGTVNRVKTALNKIPGHVDTGANFLAQYPNKVESLAKLKAAVATLPDKAAKWESFRSGSSMKYIETQHPVIRAAADYMQTAYQRADRTILNVVKPIEHALQNFAWNDKQGLVQLGQLFKKEMFERRTFTPEQLLQAGFSEKQVKIYSQIRDAFNKAWSAQNEVLKAKGITELSKHEYYLSSRWTGDWRSNVYDKDGHLVWVIKDYSKKGVEQALDHLEANGIPIDRSKSEVAFTRNNRGTPQDVPAAYASMMQHISESNPLAQKVREILDAKLMASAHETLAQSKHFKNKANIRGFVGDRPWMNPFDDARDMFHEQINYLKNSFQWSEYNKAAGELKDILNDPDIVKQAPKAVQQANHIVDHYLGATEHKMFQRLEDSISKATGHSRQDIQNSVNFAKTGWILQKMGTNVGVIAQNIIQPVNTIPFHTILSENGMKHNPLRTLLATTADTVAGLANHYGRKIGAPELGYTSKIGQDALRYAEQNGILDLSAFDEHTNVTSSRAQVAVQRTLGMPIMTADKISKFSAFLSFVHHLEQSGKFANRMELFKEAEHYMNASMVDPRMPERPFIIQDTGIVGNAAYTLQSYTINYLNQLHMLSTRAFVDRKPTALLEFLAISGALSGLAGMTAVNYGVAGYDAVRNQLAKIKPEWYDSLPDLERMLLVDVGEGMGKAGEAMKYGIPSMLTGADLSKKFETTVSAPVVGPIMDVAKQAGAVASGLMDSDKSGLAKAAYTVAPAGVGQGLIDADSGAFQDKLSGKYAPPSSGDFSKGYFRSDTDKLMRRLGVTSIPESRQKEMIYQQAKAQANDKLVNTGLAEKYVRSIMEGNGATGKNDYIANLANRAPDQVESLVQTVMQKYIVDRNLDASAINIMKAKHLQAVQNWQKYYGAKNATK